LARIACVRAFLAEPALVLLESPVQGQGTFMELRDPLLSAVVAARSDGAAVVWHTRSAAIWNDRSFPA
jgi:hypothetical protein